MKTDFVGLSPKVLRMVPRYHGPLAGLFGRNGTLVLLAQEEFSEKLSVLQGVHFE